MDSLKTTTLELAFTFIVYIEGLSWWWSYGSWIYNYLYNQCLSPTKLRVRISLMYSWRGVLIYSKQHYVIKFVS